MKKILLYAILLGCGFSSYSQTEVTFNTMYPNGMFGQKRLDTVYQLPRVATRYWTGYGTWGSFLDTARSAISLTTIGTSGAATYTTATGVLNIPDYAGGSGWALTGNAGTTAGTNFVGTTDNVSLTFKIRGIRAGLIDSTAAFSATAGGMLLYGYRAGEVNTDPTTTAIGNYALKSSITGSGNTAVGHRAGTSLTGVGNTVMGRNAFSAATTMTNSAVFGYQAALNFTGSSTVAFGYEALVTGSGNDNIAIGRDAMGDGTVSGAQNVAIGRDAGLTNSSGAGNIFLGYNAGLSNTTIGSQIFISSLGMSTATYIEQQNKSAIYGQQSATTLSQKLDLNAKVGINTTAPTAFLHIMGRETVDAGTAPIKLPTPTVSLTTTAASGTGTVATITYATTTTPAFVVGSTITIAGVTPAGYNETDVVTACTATSVSYVNTTTGAQTVAGTISQGALMTTPEAYALENDATDLYYTNSTATRFTIAKVLKGSATLDFANTLALTSTDLTITVTGAADSDVVSFGVPNGSVNANSTYQAWVSAANTVTIRFSNHNTVTAIDPASGTFKVKVFKD